MMDTPLFIVVNADIGKKEEDKLHTARPTVQKRFKAMFTKKG